MTTDVLIDEDPAVIAVAVRTLAADAHAVLGRGRGRNLDHLLGRIDDLLDGLGDGRLGNLRFWLDGLRRRVLALQE